MPSHTINRRSFIGSLASTTALAAATLTLPPALRAQEQAEPIQWDTLSAKARILIRRPPEEAFNAFAEASAMSKFWFTRRDSGLVEGEPSVWFLGADENAFSFEVQVKEFQRPKRMVIEWENGGELTQVAWTFEGVTEGETILTIEETGFTGSRQSILKRTIDSTGGFNQVIVAAKALIEHGVGVNLVADQAKGQ